jgi:hypothetical protein
VETGFEGRDPLQEGEAVMPHARGGLVPILGWEAESSRQGNRIKQQQGAHDAVSSDLVSHLYPKISGAAAKKGTERGLADSAYPVIRYVMRRVNVFVLIRLNVSGMRRGLYPEVCAVGTDQKQNVSVLQKDLNLDIS